MTISAYVIGIPEKYRGAPLENQLTQAQVPYTRIAGVVGSYRGRPVDDYVDHDFVRRTRREELTQGEVGCALAHVEAVRSSMTAPDDWAMILEDDARICDPESLAELLDFVDTQTAADQPIIIMLFARRVVALRGAVRRLSRSSIHELAVTPYTTTAYLANRAARDEISRSSIPVHGTADWPPKLIGRVRFLCAYPWILEPAEATASTIGDRRVVDAYAGRTRRAISDWGHLTWFKDRRVYGTYRSYVANQLREPLIRFLMFGRIQHFTPRTSPHPPLATRAAHIAYRLTRRPMRRKFV